MGKSVIFNELTGFHQHVGNRPGKTVERAEGTLGFQGYTDLMDSAMHRIGLHGKGFIPLMLGFDCSVPATLSSRIMETERERLICAFAASLIPCAARSVVIMGLVAEYVGFQWAAVLYLLDFALVFALGRVAFKALPGEPVGLIMEMPS